MPFILKYFCLKLCTYIHRHIYPSTHHILGCTNFAESQKFVVLLASNIIYEILLKTIINYIEVISSD